MSLDGAKHKTSCEVPAPRGSVFCFFFFFGGGGKWEVKKKNMFVGEKFFCSCFFLVGVCLM